VTIDTCPKITYILYLLFCTTPNLEGLADTLDYAVVANSLDNYEIKPTDDVSGIFNSLLDFLHENNISKEVLQIDAGKR